ncbi:MAG TPA: MlaD family protein [Nitrospiraceae bacterium]|jgi:phospholipid/cholesterol/gamma-HCH transport system substrate-binding protein|nr:MlaD family protein [Nitrospiraceae bacterium]
MEPKVNYVLVGLFVVVLSAVLLGIVLWLGKGEYGTVYDRYYAFMQESVAGLSVNSPVKYRGVEVGYVADIRLNPENPEEVRLTLDITRGTPIKEDTVAVLHVQGLTGFAIVDLTGGTRDSPPLTAKPGQAYAVIKTGPSLLARLDSAVSRLLEDQSLSRLLANLTTLAQDARGVIDQENRAALKQILSDLATVSRTLAARSGRVDQGLTGAAQTAEHLAKLSRTLNEQIPALLERVNRSAASLQAMTEELARTGKAIGALVNETKPNVEQFSRQTLPETSLLIAELRQLTATLQRVARQIEREPNALVFGRSLQPKGPGE